MSNRLISFNNPASLISAFMEDDFFGSSFDDLMQIPTKVSNTICSAVYPKSDIYTTEDGSLHIECAVAGYSEDEISASYQDEYITITLKKKDADEKRKYLQSGIKYSSGSGSTISFYIDPTYYNADEAVPSLENGIFSITVPRNEKLAKNRVLFGKPDEETKAITDESSSKKAKKLAKKD